MYKNCSLWSTFFLVMAKTLSVKYEFKDYVPFSKNYKTLLENYNNSWPNVHSSRNSWLHTIPSSPVVPFSSIFHFICLIKVQMACLVGTEPSVFLLGNWDPYTNTSFFFFLFAFFFYFSLGKSSNTSRANFLILDSNLLETDMGEITIASYFMICNKQLGCRLK